jgi:hypothetical protein
MFTHVILDTQEAEVRRISATLGKQFTRPYLKKKSQERTSCGCVVRVSPVGPGRHQLPRGEEAEAAA